jgi:hypothetical protein
MDIIVSTIKTSDNDYSRNSLDSGDQVLSLMDGAGTDRVGVEISHSPAERTLLLAELGVVALLSLLQEKFVILLAVLGKIESLRLVATITRGGGSGRDFAIARDLGLDLAIELLVLSIVLNDSIVGDTGTLSLGRSRALE